MENIMKNNFLKFKKANISLQNEKEELEKMRKQLITNISHEFKTPLTLISGYNELLKSKFKDKDDEKYVDVIISETEKLNRLIVEFLEL